MAINASLLRETLRHILRHPEEWRQSTWRCGTAACFAGHAAILAGGRWLAEDGGSPAVLALVATEEEILDGLARPYTLPDGTQAAGVHLAERARRALGLNDDQQARLFATQNDLPQLHIIVSELCADAEEVAA